MPSTPTNGSARHGFGTFGGVFTPCTLTILGVIMFLRFDQVVGHSGIGRALLILLAAKLITTLTTLSLSAIATNTEVRGGGAYYLISRSLGADHGGAIGLVFFIAQAISVAMYVIGFTEAAMPLVRSLTPEGAVAPTVVEVASVTNLVVFICVFIGAGWTIKVQYGILAILGLSLVSFFAGALPLVSIERMTAGWGPPPPGASSETLWTMFALFFPAVTGIMAGANMSGDLEDPGNAIPRGTLLAILVTGVIYGAIALTLGGAASPERLRSGESMVMQDLALVPWLITAGVFSATLSSALGSMMGAPRVLQALARDRVFTPLSIFGHGSGPNDEPRPAVVLTYVVAQLAILAGDLNAIAPVITMCFLLTYGYLNLATFAEAISASPTWRPRFRWAHWTTAAIGGLGCMGVMLLISPITAIVSTALLILLQRHVDRSQVEVSFGDVRRGIAFDRARRNLLKLDDRRYHPKSWRPSIMAFTGAPHSRRHLTYFGAWLTGGRGMLTLAQVIVGSLDERAEMISGQEQKLRAFLRTERLEGFPAVVVAESLGDGVAALVQCAGIGAMRPNLVLVGWPGDPDKSGVLAASLGQIAKLGRSIAMIRFDEPTLTREPSIPPDGTIDVWWRGNQNGPMMLLLAHLLTRASGWGERRIRLLRVIKSEGGRVEATQHLTELAAQARIEVEPSVIVAEDARTAIQQTSSRAAVTLLGFHPPAPEEAPAFFANHTALMQPLGPVIFVASQGEASLHA